MSPRIAAHGRLLEDLGLAAGVLQGLLYGVTESLHNVGYALGSCEVKHEFPIGLLLVMGICVMPKTIGRVTAGKVWQTIASKWGGNTP